MYYIILSTDLPDGRMSPIRMSHYDTGSDSLESTSGVKADSSMIIQVHQDTIEDTGHRIHTKIHTTQSQHTITRQMIYGMGEYLWPGCDITILG